MTEPDPYRYDHRPPGWTDADESEQQEGESYAQWEADEDYREWADDEPHDACDDKHLCRHEPCICGGC